ncbi:MAG: hypothetical protein JXA42_25770, partial [Anaerolineales bacterium]|nr:hypothetical protein [Anaerolineales bacterium]
WQMHLLVDPEEWKIAMGPGGALEAFIQAREQGLTRFLGVTGHGMTIAAMHLQSLARFDFDSVLLPLNYAMIQAPDYADDFFRLLELCQERKVAVQTIKSLARRPWGDRPQTCATWYQPFEKQKDIDKAVHWVLGHKNVFLNTSADINLLPRVLDAAARFQAQPGKEEMDAMIKRLDVENIFEQRLGYELKSQLKNTHTNRMEEILKKVRRRMHLIMFVTGILVVLISYFADVIGLGISPGLGTRHLAGILFGLVLMVNGVSIWAIRSRD